MPHDTNRASDIFVFDRARNVTTRVSVSTRGKQANGPSGDPGHQRERPLRRVLLVRIEHRPRRHERSRTSSSATCASTARSASASRAVALRRVAASGCESTEPALSASGRYVAFQSSATNLVRGDTNRLGGRIRARPPHRPDRARKRLELGPPGRRRPHEQRQQRAGDQRRRPLRRVPLACIEPRPGDTNRVPDIFVRDRRAEDSARQRLGRRAAGQPGKPRRLGDQRRRPLRRVHVAGLEPRRGRRQRDHGRLRPRPARRHDEASSASATQGTRATTRAPRAASSSARTTATWRSRRGLRTSSRATRTTSRTRSCAISPSRNSEGSTAPGLDEPGRRGRVSEP